MDVTAQVAVLFLVVLVGTLCRRLGYLTDSVIHGITEIVINVALPALTLYNMQREFSQEVFAGFLLTLAGTILTILVSILGGWLLFKNRPHARRAVLANLCGFSNCGFMGYPIILAIHPDWMIYAVAYNIGYSLVSWTVGISVFGGRQAASLKRALLNPNIIASLVGFALFCLRWRWPAVISDALNTVGGLTTPLSMLLIGPRICGIQPKDLKDKDYAFISALRNVILPLLVLLILKPLPLPVPVKGVLFLLTAMPLGTLVAMQAELYGGDVVFASRAVALSTLVSIGTIPLMALLL